MTAFQSLLPARASQLHDTDLFFIHVAKNKGGDYCIDAASTGTIELIRIIREYPQSLNATTPARPEEVLATITKGAAMAYFNNNTVDPNALVNGVPKWQILTTNGDFPASNGIGYRHDGNFSKTRAVNSDHSMYYLHLEDTEEYFLRLEVTVTIEGGYVYTWKNETNTKKAAAFADVNPSVGAVYALHFYDYTTQKSLWDTTRDFYEEFVLPEAAQLTVIQNAEDLAAALLAADDGMVLERDYTIPGVTTIYHAWLRAEELVRASRYSFKVTFKYLVTGAYLEPGDVCTLQSDTLAWPLPIPLRVTASALNEENICTVSADYLTTELYITDANLPTYTHPTGSPIYSDGLPFLYFIFDGTRNGTPGSPGTLRAKASGSYTL
jgi:hypothetical protein